MNSKTLHMLSLTTALLATQLAAAQDAVPAKPGAVSPAPASAPQGARQELPPAKDAAELDLRAFEKILYSPPPKPHNEMTPLEMGQFLEDLRMELRARALAFLSLYPNDPRRWDVVNGLHTSPRFVLEWNTDTVGDWIQPKRVDAVAAAAWEKKVTALRKEMETATDLPQDIKDMFARRDQEIAGRTAFHTKWSSGKEKAPDFTAYTLDNKPVRISDYRGKVVVLDFWASWCGPCKEAFPHVQALAAKYKQQGVVVIGSGTSDTRAAFEKYITRNQKNFPDILWTHDKEANSDKSASSALYDVPGFPAQFVIDREGHVVDVVVGYSQGEVILDAALARAGITVDKEIIAKAGEDMKKRGERE